MIKLLEHNIPVYEELKETLQEKDKVLLRTATGTGKSYICSKYIEDTKKKTLIVCPKTAICRAWEKMQLSNTDTITYQKLSLMNEFMLDALEYDLYVFDESHHCGGGTWSKPVNYLMQYKDAKFIGLTADSKRHSDGGRDVAVEYFDDSVVEGYELIDAVKMDILPNFSYISTIYKLQDTIEKLKKEKSNCKKNRTRIDEMLNRLEYSAENSYQIKTILQKHMPKGKRKCIVFVDAIERISEGIHIIKDVYGTKEDYYTLYSNQPIETQLKVMNAFESADTGFLFCVDMLNEGLHFKGVNTVIMLRKTTSPTVFYQQLGRCLAVGNEDVMIFDFVGNHCSMKSISACHEILNEFKTIQEERREDKHVIIKDYAHDAMEILERVRKLINDKSWTVEEDVILREYYPIEGSNCAKRLPGRTEEACRSRAYALKINIMDKWTEEEIEILKKYYPSEGSECASRLQGRTKTSCVARAGYYNIKYEDRLWSEKELTILKKYYPVEGLRCENRLKKKTKSAVKTKALDLKLKVEKQWSKEEDDILRKYYPTEGYNVNKRLPKYSKTKCSRRAKELGIGTNRTWTQEELDILIHSYPEKGPKCFSDIKTKSESACRAKVKVLRKGGFIHACKKAESWSDKELEFLNAFLNEKMTKEELLAHLPNRTWEGIRKKLKKIA